MIANTAGRERAAPKLFVGVGNELQRDDGFGVWVARRMSQLLLPPDVEVFEAGTAGIDAAPVLEGRQLVVVADAVDAGAEPGEIFRLTPQELCPRAGPARMSLHDVHLLDALDATHLLGVAPDKVLILAVQVADVSLGIGLTPAVERSVAEVVRVAIEALESRSPQPTDDAAHDDDLV